MDRIGQTFEGGVTSNGTTMTPVAALADRHAYYLRLRVEAPEGVVLPDLDEDVDGYYQLMNPDEDIDMDLDLEEALNMQKPFPMERYQVLEALTLSGSRRL